MRVIPPLLSICCVQVAFVWDVTCDFGGTSWMNFLPPETHVDWFGVNIFSNASAPVNSTECLRPFFEYSRSRGFPVMFAESTPRFVGAKVADNAWDRWFGPLISLISEFDDVTKAICYINWCASTASCLRCAQCIVLRPIRSRLRTRPCNLRLPSLNR